jgi:hypothetical protein
MSYELGDPDDRCCDEGREADIEERDADKRAEYEADRCCGHHWGNI